MALVEFIHKPGTDHGPCNFACYHKDCLEKRRLAGARCLVCRHPIGFDSSFRRGADDRPIHAGCLESVRPSALADHVLNSPD